MKLELMKNAYTEVTDEDGIRRLYDKDGVDIGTPENEE